MQTRTQDDSLFPITSKRPSLGEKKNSFVTRIISLQLLELRQAIYTR